MQTELPIESQDDAEKALVEKLRRIYARYGTLSRYFEEQNAANDESADECPTESREIALRLAAAQRAKT